jgi:TM2 domain-containing membrane protein YozV
MNCAVHPQTQAAAYCRTCGKALCEDCKRDVMGAIYCEPCIAARLQNAVPGPRVAPPPPAGPGAPNPALAGLLGFIPGVGAMYNGQFVKAFIHVIIFVLLIFAVGNANGGIEVIFGLLIGFSPIYMAFEAYKTAQAKQFGLPAPDPLGLDKLFGLQESQPSPVSSTSAAGTANVTGSAFVPPPPPSAPGQLDNSPVGAIVLLVLGVVFLLSNFNLLRIGHLFPLMLIGLGLWLAYKRLVQQA